MVTDCSEGCGKAGYEVDKRKDFHVSRGGQSGCECPFSDLALVQRCLEARGWWNNLEVTREDCTFGSGVSLEIPGGQGCRV